MHKNIPILIGNNLVVFQLAKIPDACIELNLGHINTVFRISTITGQLYQGMYKTKVILADIRYRRL